jgi:hypothetical protein
MQRIQTSGLDLHKACEAPQSLLVIQKVLEECPQAAHVVAVDGNLPIHTACLNQADVSVLGVLVRRNPDCLAAKDAHGNYPLHLAAFSGAPLSSIKYLVHKHPETILERNDAGETPLERAKNPFFGIISAEVVDWLENPYFQHIDDVDDRSEDLTEPMVYSDSSSQQRRFVSSFTRPLGIEETRWAIRILQRSKSERNEEVARGNARVLPQSQQLAPPLSALVGEELSGQYDWMAAEHITLDDLKNPACTGNLVVTDVERYDIQTTSTTPLDKLDEVPISLGAPVEPSSSLHQSALREKAEMQTVFQVTTNRQCRRPSNAEPQPMYPNLNATPAASQMPGAVMVKKPAIHPNSAMYRAAYS